jgi:hypothetical protein
MKTSLPYKKIIVEVVCCLYILLFVYAAVSKLLDFENFRIQLAQSPLLSAYAGIVAPGIIGLELLLAGLLVMKSERFISLFVCYFLMVSFTVYIYIILNYSEFVPCSCGGILEKLGWYEHMIFNIAFAVLGIIALLLSTEDKVKIKKVALYVVFTTLLAIGTMIVLYLSSEHIIKKENNFTRRYLQHPVQEEKVYDLKFNSYYFSGYADGKIYLGNYTAPLVLTSIDTTLVHTQTTKIVLDNPHHQFRSITLKVETAFVYAYDGTVPVIYRADIGTSYARTISLGDVYFSQLQISGPDKFAFRAQSRKQEKNILGTFESSAKEKVKLNYKLLEKQSDGVFDTDGVLIRDAISKEILYGYYYRNGFLVMDSDLSLLQKLHTIDTISRAQVRSLKLSKGEHKLEAPPLLVNKDMVVHGQVLFVESSLLGKFESRDIWNNAVVIDMYKTNGQSYLGSLFIQNRGENKMAQMLVTDKYLFVLSGTEIVRYRLAQAITRNFKKGEAEKPYTE